MIIKIEVHIYADVRDDEEGQDLCNALSLGLEHRIDGLPVGEMMGVNIERYTKPTDAELDEAGMTE